jgi:hypothetical protein
MRAWLTVAALPLIATVLMLGTAQRASAQARDLASPVTGQGGASAATPGSSTAAGAPSSGADSTSGAASTGSPTTPPSSYESVDVPPPPGGASGIQYPGDPAARARVLTTDSGVRIPSGIATRLRALDSDFQVLAARGGGSIVDGVLGILTGGLAITIGILVNDYGTGGRMGMSPYLFVYGGAGAGRGILNLILMTNPSGPAVTYAHMPMTSMAEVNDRLAYGERELAALADRSRLQRILDGSLSIATGLAIIPVYLAPNGFELAGDDIFGIFILIGAGISAVSGVIQLVSTTEAERRWSAYEELRNRLAARGDGDRDADAARDEPVPPRPQGARVEPVVAGGANGAFLGARGTW